MYHRPFVFVVVVTSILLVAACTSDPPATPALTAISTMAALSGSTLTLTAMPQPAGIPTPTVLPDEVETLPASSGDLSEIREALAAYEPLTDARPTVNMLLADMARWLEVGGDLSELEAVLDEALTLNASMAMTKSPVKVKALDLTGDTREDVVVHIPAIGLPLLVFVNQGDTFAGYALPPDYAETLTDSWPVDSSLTLRGVPQSPLQLTDMTGDGVPEILLTYLFPGGSSFHLQPIVFQWYESAFRPIFAAHLINWAGEATLTLEPDPRSTGGRQIVIRYPYLYANGFDHKMVNHPLGQQIWRWSEDAGRFVKAEAHVDLEHSGWSSDATVSTGDRLRWFTNEGEQMFRGGDYDGALRWYNQVLRLASEEKWRPGEDDPDWVAFAAFRRAATLLLQGRPDGNAPAGTAADGLVAMQTLAAEHQEDMLGELADAFLKGYGDGSHVDAVARAVAVMQTVDLYTFVYYNSDKPGVLHFPMDNAAGILYPGAGLSAYLNARPALVDDLEALRAGLAEAGFAVEDVERTEEGAIQVALRLPDAPNTEGGRQYWTLAKSTSGWRVVSHSDGYTSFDALLDHSAEWPIVGDFRTAP